MPMQSHVQLVDASACAAAARQRRAAVCQSLKTGVLSLEEVFEVARHDQAVARLRVVALLEALPGIGATKAAALLAKHRIAPSRRVRGLGAHQRERLQMELQ